MPEMSPPPPPASGTPPAGEPPPLGTDPAGVVGRAARAPAPHGGKLSEALGFGAGPASAPIMPPLVPTREPKKAFEGGRAKLEKSGMFDTPAGVPAVTASSAPRAPVTAGGFGGPILVPDHRPVPDVGRAPDLGLVSGPARAAPPMVKIPAGTFLYGEARRPEPIPTYEIDRDPVTNGEYERFVRAAGHRPPLYWRDGRCPEDLRDHPVVGVDYFDAVAYARWAGKDLPFEDEWERAARGTDGRTFPWGDDPESASNTAREALKMTVPVGFHARNVSPDGVRDMVGNTWEMTHTPAPGGGVVVRGGSWYDFALYAKTWFRFASRTESRNGTIGFRCVKRPFTRKDAARAVPESSLDAEIAYRRGRAEPADPSMWSPEKRDLVPDLRRLKQLVAAQQAEAAAVAAAPSPARPAVRKAFTPAEAAAAAAAATAAAAAAAQLAPKPAVAAPQIPAAAKPPPVPALPAVASAPAVPAKPAAPVAAPAPVVPPKPAVPAVPAVAAADFGAPRQQPAPPGPQMPAVAPAPAPKPVVPAPAPAPAAAPAPVAAAPAKAPVPAAPQVLPAPAPAAKPKPAPAPVAAEKPKEPELVGAGADGGDQGSWLRFALIVMGFLAASVLAVVAILHAQSSPPARESSDEIAKLYDLPAAVPAEGDRGAPDILGGASPDSALPALTHGSTLLVFAPGSGAAGAETAALATELHRRLRGTGLRVTLVLPREDVAKGADVHSAAVASALASIGAHGDVPVLLDPPDAAGPGRLRRKFWHVSDDVAAVLVKDGREEVRVSPPSADQPLLLSHVAQMVGQELRSLPKPRPADDGDEEGK